MVFYKSNPGFELFSQLITAFFAQQPRIMVFKPRFQNPGFQFPVSYTNWYFIFQVKPENDHFQVYFKKSSLMIL